MTSPAKTSTLDRIIPWIIGAALTIVYTALAQANLKHDGAAFITWYYERGMPHQQHPIFGYYLYLCLKLGQASGLTLVRAGLLQSALAAAAAAGLYFCWLRRLAIATETAALFTLLFALSGTVLEIATTVELYGVTLLVVIVSLHAWLGEVRKPGIRGAVGLWVSCLLIVMLHVGWALWVLVVYLSLAWRERARRRRALFRVGEGALVAAALGLWFVAGRHFGGLGLEYQKTFYSAFAPAGINLLTPFWTVFVGLIVNGGLVLFPAIAAAFRYRHKNSNLFVLWAMATAVFFVIFGFWPADRGEFYLPVLAVWGFFAARAAQEWSRDSNTSMHYTATAIGYALMLWAGMRVGEAWLIALFFWIYAAASARWGWVEAIRKQKQPVGNPRALLACLLIGVTLVLYLPQAISETRPNAVTKRLNVFNKIAPRDARLVTAIAPYVAFAQTGHPTQAPLADPFAYDFHNTRQYLASFIEDARAGGPPIWMDEASWNNREKIFNFPGEKPIEWRDNVSIHESNGEVFYELKVERRGKQAK